MSANAANAAAAGKSLKVPLSGKAPVPLKAPAPNPQAVAPVLAAPVVQAQAAQVAPSTSAAAMQVGGGTVNPANRSKGNGKPKDRSKGNGKPDKPKRKEWKTSGPPALDTKNVVKAAVKRYALTATYLRGRDQLYPDAAALAAFNAWVTANAGELEPSEQKVCLQCGHVDFTLCVHSLAPAAIVPVVAAPTVVPANKRYHEWSFRPIKALKDGFQWPAFDTHSVSDNRMNGFSNDHLTDELIERELYGYIVFNMQPSYSVNGREDRALKLAHCHRLASKWVTSKNLEAAVAGDMHMNSCIRMTIQRACDNKANAMLYEERNPAQNFGLAWLPGSRMQQLLLVLLVLLALCNLKLTFGLLLRGWEILQLTVAALVCVLNYMAATVPDLGMKMFVSATVPPNGNMHVFTCVSTDYDNRWFVPEGDAHAVTQSCEFSDWVMAGLTEGSSLLWGTFQKASDGMKNLKDEHSDYCGRLELELAGYQYIWSSDRFMEYLGQGRLGSWDVLRLWFWTLYTTLRLLIFRC